MVKKIEVEVWYAEKKRLSTREKFKGDLYWKHYNVLSFANFLCCFCLHITNEQIRGGAKFSWAQGRKIPKYGPGWKYYCTVFPSSELKISAWRRAIVTYFMWFSSAPPYQWQYNASYYCMDASLHMFYNWLFINRLTINNSIIFFSHEILH
jgi:hypothetical protein